MITKKIAQFPLLPGVYIFKGRDGEPIYIGKAKSLKKRVASYFNPKNQSWKTELLLSEAISCEHIVTKSENEALIIEAELIKTHQPKFNTLLKDGQPFVYLVITKEDLPQLKLVRNKKLPDTYFGPFIYKGQARSVYRFLLEQLQLYICNKKLPNGCLQFHLGRCAGSCTTTFDKSAYLFRLKLAKNILAGKNKTLERELGKQIKLHSKKLEFEQAKKLATIRANLHNIIAIIALKIAQQDHAALQFYSEKRTSFDKLVC